MAAPNEKERKLILQFREDVKDILHDERLHQDEFLLRWIRARDHDLSKAKPMLANSLKWRQENQIDTILSHEKSGYFKQHFKYWIHGHDKCGRPLLILPVGTWDFKGMMDDGKAEVIVVEWARILEEVLAVCSQAGKLKNEDYPVTQYIAICDWTGFAYRQVISWKAISKLLEMVSVYEGFYPETLFAGIFMNCPKIFCWVLPLMKKCMSGATVTKLQVYGMNKEEWLPELLKMIEPENLFAEHGGPSTNQKPLDS